MSISLSISSPINFKYIYIINDNYSYVTVYSFLKVFCIFQMAPIATAAVFYEERKSGIVLSDLHAIT